MHPTTLACPVDISEETLSAWRDGLLDAAEGHRLERHIAECDACQQRLASFEHVARVLRDQPDPQLTAQVWRGLQRRAAQSGSRPRSAGGFALGRVPPAAVAAVAAALVVAMFGAAFAFRISHGPGTSGTGFVPTATATATSTTTAPATPSTTTTTTGIPAGWTAGAIPDGYLPAITFAPSSPSQVYAVSILNGGGVTVSGSRDGGTTWRALSNPTSGQNSCFISVDPADATDVALACTPAASSGFTVLRSFDGGKTWTQPPLGVKANCYQGMGWADSTLLMTFGLCDAGSSQTQLIASMNKGPFKRLDSDGKVSGITLGDQIRLITGKGSTYYVQMGYIGYNPTQLADTLIVSQDAGATWKTVTLADNGSRVHLYAVDPTGSAWVGVYENPSNQLGISTNAGQSWHKLPAPWVNELGPSAMFVTPDGSVFVTDERAHFEQIQEPIYAATPGATQWSTAVTISAAEYPNLFPIAAGWNSKGHPTRLWARYASNSQNGTWYLVSHSLSI